MNRILFAAPKSGSGKTMITCGMIELCKRKGLKTAALKCGPDYIDPMFHRQVLGVPSGNIDTFFTDENTTKYLLSRRAEGADITILEGVMGYYDGLGGTTEEASTYQAAKVTETPVILVVDAKGASLSLAAVIKGMIEYRADSGIQGILLNRVSAGFYGRLKELVERECSIPVVGYMPEVPALALPSRHLGLIAPEETENFREWIEKLADTMEETVDLEAVLRLAEGAKECCGDAPELPTLSRKVRLAVARDEAFSFYYEENLDLLQKMGAELVFFSPLHDEKLPVDIDGMLLGGGYPENYGEALEKNEVLRKAIREQSRKGMPILAECGGFLYLQETLEGADNTVRAMTGVLNGKGYPTGKLCRFGYVELECGCSGVLGERGEHIRGHEFHYFDCTENGSGFVARKPIGKTAYSCMVHTNTLAAGFPHLYYYSNPRMVYRFLENCAAFGAGRRAKAHWDSIAKPIDSLGLLEEHTVKLCRIAGTEAPFDLRKRALLILCGDHGVVEEGVTQTGSEVTKIVSENFAKGCSTVNYMAAKAGVDVYTVDMGMKTPPYEEKTLVQGAVIDRKVAPGTKNLAKEPAMTMEQCRQAVAAGKELVRELKEKGYTIAATGEMGIGNTTPTSVLAAVFLGRSPEEVTGKGAGLSGEGIRKKKCTVERALQRIKEKELTEPLEILAEAGGLEIAGMVGVFLGGMEQRMPIVIDGAISSVAALTAWKIDGRVSDFLLASHQSEEAAGRLALEAMELKAILHGEMCLGEGTGAMALFPILDMAVEVYRNMGTFEDYAIEAYERFT